MKRLLSLYNVASDTKKLKKIHLALAEPLKEFAHEMGYHSTIFLWSKFQAGITLWKLFDKSDAFSVI